MDNTSSLEYPLHRLVWKNDASNLERILSSGKYSKDSLELKDPRGRTPLLLAIVLKEVNCIRILLEHGANCLAIDKNYWSCMDEAITVGDPDLLRLILQHRHFQLLMMADATVPKVLSKLQESPDFYVEMAWSFSSWIPFVSHILPSDTYKIWKSGTSVRIDTTLVGFENRKWKRGRLSLVFRLGKSNAEIYEINHDTKQYSLSKIEFHSPPNSVASVTVSPEELSLRITNPAVSSYVDVDAISFERAKTGSGFFGSLMSFGNSVDKTEEISGFECKVYECTDVKLISQKRTEHLLKKDKKRSSSNTQESDSSNERGGDNHEKLLASMLSAAVKRNVEVEETKEVHGNVTEEEYFDCNVDLGKRYIGKPRELTTKVQKFHATLWMSDSFPLSLQDQILPIIDLMAQRHSHVQKLKEFITVHLPAGFPVKINLPLYYVLTGTVEQRNVHGTTTPVEGVHTFRDVSQEPTHQLPHQLSFCAIEESVFDVPPGYRKVKKAERGTGDLLSNSMDATLESQQVSRPNRIDELESNEDLTAEDDAQMQMALAMSLGQMDVSSAQGNEVETTEQALGETNDIALKAALAASINEMGNTDAARAAQEEEDLKRAIELSLQDND